MFSLFTRTTRSGQRSFRPLPERLEARECLSGGLLDPTFNGTGTRLLDRPDIVKATAVQPNGKIVVAGGASIARLNADGSSDATFAARSGGIVTLNIGAGSGYGGAAVRDVTLQPDGKILVCGTAFTDRWSANESEYFVVRLNADGTYDGGFAKRGIFEWNPRAGREYANELAVLADGSIVVGGNADSGGLTAFKLNASGTRLTSFAGGEFRYDFGGRRGGANALAIAPNGDIVLAGGTHADTVTWSDIGAVVVLTPSGGLDTAFNGTGVLEVHPAGYRTLSLGDVVMQGGQIVVTGTYTNSIGSDDPDGFVPRYGIVSRYSLAGALDTTFGAGGSFTSDQWNPSVVVAADGSLFVAGARQYPALDGSGHRTYDANGNLITITDSAVAHLTAGGVLDTSYGTTGTGFVVLALGPSNTEMCGLALAPDGGLIVSGFTYTSSSQRKAALARLTAP